MKLALVILMLALPVVASPAYDARQAARPAMEAYLKAHPACEWCGNSGSLLNRLNVHHVIPVSVGPALASDPANMVTLCRRCHIAIGHDGDMACRRYIVNLRELMQSKVVETISNGH